MSKVRILNVGAGLVDPAGLKLHEANPRQGDLGAVIESFKANGFWGRVVVDKRTGRVLAGNHRVMAARQLDMPEIPVEYVETDGDEHALRILLADNRTSDLGDYDRAGLADLLEHLASTDAGLVGTGYDGDALDELLSDLGRTGDDWAGAMGALPDGEKAPFQQMTFTLHDTQADTVREAMERAKDEGAGFPGSVNENSNGNALAAICAAYLAAP